MGKIKQNIITKGFSGKYSEDLMFRQVRNKTIFSRVGVSTKAPTAAQVAVRERFIAASLYATAAIDNPLAYDDYKKMAEHLKVSSAYVAALTDYATEPEIAAVFTAAYNGDVGDIINITPKMPYKLVDIDVSILRADGTVVESGKAVAHGSKWRYVATVSHAQVPGSTLVLSARDRIRREVAFQQAL